MSYGAVNLLGNKEFACTIILLQAKQEKFSHDMDPSEMGENLQLLRQGRNRLVVQEMNTIKLRTKQLDHASL